MKNTQTTVATIFIVIIAIAGIFYFSSKKGPDEMKNTATYTNTSYGVSFEYPAHYFLTEREVGNGERHHYLVMLVEDTEFNRDLIAGKILGTEGPIAITLDIYQNNLDKLTAEMWMKNTSESNFKLGNGSYDVGIAGGLQVVSYLWDGLYRGKTVAIANDNNVYAFTATYNADSDMTIRDLDQLLGTVKIK